MYIWKTTACDIYQRLHTVVLLASLHHNSIPGKWISLRTARGVSFMRTTTDAFIYIYINMRVCVYFLLLLTALWSLNESLPLSPTEIHAHRQLSSFRVRARFDSCGWTRGFNVHPLNLAPLHSAKKVNWLWLSMQNPHPVVLSHWTLRVISQPHAHTFFFLFCHFWFKYFNSSVQPFVN